MSFIDMKTGVAGLITILAVVIISRLGNMLSIFYLDYFILVIVSLVFINFKLIVEFLKQFYKLFVDEYYLSILFAFSDFINSFDGNAKEFNEQKNIYLAGNYAPVDEEVSNIPMKLLSGQFPKGLEGLFLRVGPNPISNHNDHRYHWFDGHGMVHSIKINKDSKAYYSNQFVPTPRYEIEKKHNRVIFFQFGEFTGFLGLFKALFLAPLFLSYFKLNTLLVSQANTAITFYNDRLLIGHEGSLPYEIKWQSNNSFVGLGFESLNGSLNYPVNAHPKVDSKQNKLYFQGYNFDASQPALKQGCVNGFDNALSSYYGIESKSRPWAHDFIVTENYLVVMESSIQFNANTILEGKIFSFEDKHKFRVGLAPKSANSSDEIKWYSSDKAFGYVHVLNAWEQVIDGDLHVLIWAPLTTHFDIDFEAVNEYFMHEISVNTKTGEIKFTLIDLKHSVEFPRVHLDYVGLPADFGYSSELIKDENKAANFGGVVKYNFKNKSVVNVITFASGLVSGEVIPIPKPGNDGKKSDGVFLATFIHNVNTNQSEFHVYDGTTMSSKPVMVLGFDNSSSIRVPYGFHAEWISELQLKRHFSI